VLRTSNNRAQQKKMMFLERNLEQLTVVQRQLVEQNSSLKKEVAIAERKLIARNERIQSLESLLQDSQEKLTAANHRYAQYLPYDMLCILTPLQVRSPTHSCQRTSRSREGRFHTRSWLSLRSRCFLCLWRRRRLKNCQAAPRRRRWSRARWTRPPCHWQPAETGWRGRGQAEADKLVLQQRSMSQGVLQLHDISLYFL
jgi:hypothetical protein